MKILLAVVGGLLLLIFPFIVMKKEKVTKDNRELDLNKYYNKYKEEEYKIVLSKSISKKLDKKTVNLTVHDKKESFVVDYDSKEYIYRT